jgi:hypothetical protein
LDVGVPATDARILPTAIPRGPADGDGSRDYGADGLQPGLNRMAATAVLLVRRGTKQDRETARVRTDAGLGFYRRGMRGSPDAHAKKGRKRRRRVLGLPWPLAKWAWPAAGLERTGSSSRTRAGPKLIG